MLRNIDIVSTVSRMVTNSSKIFLLGSPVLRLGVTENGEEVKIVIISVVACRKKLLSLMLGNSIFLEKNYRINITFVSCFRKKILDISIMFHKWINCLFFLFSAQLAR